METSDKILRAFDIALLAASILLFVFTFGKRDGLKKEIANRTDYEALCESFIKDYVKNVSLLRDYIYRDEYADSVILRIDSVAFKFAEHTDIIEYNIYALDRNMYWEQFREDSQW